MNCIAGEGGGMRGIMPLGFYSAIWGKEKVTRNLDLFMGISTHSIIAYALGIGKTPDEIADLYISERKKIFSKNLFYRAKTTLGIGGPSYPLTGLGGCLKDFFGDKKVTDTNFRVMAASADTLNGQIVITDSANKKWSETEIVLACLMSSAAPTFLPSVVGMSVDFPGKKSNDVDGGVFASDPSLMVLAEIEKERKKRPAYDWRPELSTPVIDELLSVGTGYKTVPYETRGWGIKEWLFKKIDGERYTPLIDVIQTFQKKKDHYYINGRTESDPNLRFNVVNSELVKRVPMDCTDKVLLEELFAIGKDLGDKYLADGKRLTPNGTGADIPV